MQVKRYEVSSISEALTKIKEDLGPDAIILSAKKIDGLGRATLEVMAARDDKVKAAENILNSSLPLGSSHLPEKQEDIYKLFHSEMNELKAIIRSAQREKSLSRELEELKETMDKFFDILGARKGKVNPDVNHKIYYHLLASGFTRASACNILEAVSSQIASPDQLNDAMALSIVENYMVKSLPAVNRSKVEKRIKSFVGATGVGKTTTLAKLAARYLLMKKMKVGLVTTDTFRIAATEQLRTYAKIMGIRMEVASTRESFQKALQLLSDADVVLVDTPGRGRIDDGYVNILDILQKSNDLETSLLISATSSEDNLQEMVKKYSSFDYDNLIITKVDESRRFGFLYDVVNKAKKPVSYLTCGQNVPQDIEEATPQKMAKLMMGNDLH